MDFMFFEKLVFIEEAAVPSVYDEKIVISQFFLVFFTQELDTQSI